ncbi:amino acid adenylation domain-containing protein, partial [Maribacter sp. 2-571]|uniref:amino acid adenylation domain-containing protein n=1 Tax=Maribacter sp. 2-571 TaxID=3417569 RepID=UPI003D355BF0
KDLNGLSYFLVTGEAVRPSLLGRWFDSYPDIPVVNAYGPTEAADDITLEFIREAPKGTNVPIGKPVSNIKMYVVSGSGNLCPVGVVGELWVGGIGVGRGYLNDIEKTHGSFMANPFDQGATRLYRTGDLGRWLSDGSLEYVGRKDDQVKVRGYRIELGEIESVLSGVEGIDGACVLARADSQGNRRLVGYVVGDESLAGEFIEGELMERLPEYMVPRLWVFLESLPLTRNGKIDRKSLPDPDVSGLSKQEYVAPGNEVEERLADIWQELLGIDKVGIHDNFFELGGHSLLATRLVSMVRRNMDIELAIADIFVHPTVEGLAQVLSTKEGGRLLPAVTLQERPDRIPLSFSQERLWFLDQLQGSEEYHIPIVLRLKGNLDRIVLEDSLRTIVERHEVLRTVYVSEDGIGYQQIRSEDDWSIDVEEVKDVSRIVELVNDFTEVPFELATDYMFRARLYVLAPQEYVLAGVFHHIASDGWSDGVLVSEFIELYDAYSNDRTVSLPALSVQYADYAIWQREYLEGEVLEDQLRYWEESLAGVETLDFPTDRIRPSVRSTAGASFQMELDSNLRDELMLLSQKEGATLFMTLLTAFKVLLYRYSGQSDISVGTPIANRTQKELEGMIGFFVNTLVLRSDLGGDPVFTELLAQVKGTTLGAYDHQSVPFEKVVDRVVKIRDINVNPLFQVMFVLQNTPNDDGQEVIGFDNLAIESFEGKGGTNVKFDLTLFCEEDASGISLNLEYRKDLFDESTIKGILDSYRELLISIVSCPSSTLDRLSMIEESGHLGALEFSNKEKFGYGSNQTIVDLFEDRVSKTPDAVALTFESAEMTYGELNKKANQLARYLVKKGVVEDSIVAICANRSMETVIGILGILKSGAAYLPIDPKHPKDRIRHMLTDSNTALLVSHSDLEGTLKATCDNIEFIHLDGEVLQGMSKRRLSKKRKPESLAYIIYTSGSTGRPKGVMVEHHNLVNYIDSQTNTYGINDSDVILQTSNLVFDASVEQVFLSLLNGCCLVLIKEDTIVDEVLLKRVLADHAVTHIHTTPGILKVLDPSIGTSSLRRVVVGGEECSVALANAWVQNYDFYNKYGPTEATITATIKYFPKGSTVNRVSIGGPIQNTDVHILSKGLRTQPVGAIGELCIGGEGLTRGYLNRPELSSDRFIVHPKAGQRLYLTGDLAKRLPNGEIEFIGRMDDQVKVRGYRIELGEIESVLSDVEGISGSCVSALPDVQGNKRLVGYVVGDESLAGEFIEVELMERLPEYMVPRLWVFLESLPLTRNGKIDRKSLPDPDVSGLSKQEYVAPGNEVEERLADIWQELLGIDKVGIHDNFFELGGHSLLAMRLVSMVRRNMDIELAIADIFVHPTVEGLAQVLSTKEGGRLLPAVTLQERPDRIPLSYSQERLWFLDQLQGSEEYHIPIVLRLKGNLDRIVLEDSLRAIVERHEILRTVIKSEEGIGYQQIIPSDDWSLESREVKDGMNLEGLIEEILERPFVLSEDYMVRAGLFTVNSDSQVLAIVLHHISSDNWSNTILFNEFTELYSAMSEGTEADLPGLSLQYSDYAIWQRKHLTDAVLEKQLLYWEGSLSGVPVLDLPTDYARPSLQSNDGRSVSYRLNKSLTDGLMGLSQGEGTTLFMMLLTAFKVLLYRYSGQSDICVGIPIANRTQREIEPLVGFFLNTVALRSDLGGDPVFTELLEQVKETTLGAYDHQEVPFEKVVDRVVKTRDMSRSPLFQVLFNFMVDDQVDDQEKERADLGEVVITNEPYEESTSQFDLSFDITQTGEGLDVSVSYCSDLYEEGTIVRMLSHYESLLGSIVLSPGATIGELELLSASEETELLEVFNGSEIDLGNTEPINVRFESIVSDYGESTAVVHGMDSWSYDELNNYANQVAHGLLGAGLSPGTCVGVYMDRSPVFLGCMMGIMKAGGVYVPLDTQNPPSRIKGMLCENNFPYLITSCDLLSGLDGLGKKTVLLVDDHVSDVALSGNGEVSVHDGGYLSGMPEGNPVNVNDMESWAYVLFTSGSTGVPKGAITRHNGAMNHLLAEYSLMDLDDGFRFLQSAGIGSDISVWQMLGPVLKGGSCVMIDKMDLLDYDLVLSVIKDRGVNVVEFVPTYMWGLLEHIKDMGGAFALPSLSWIMLVGESIPVSMVNDLRELYPGVRMVNAYGPCEASDDVIQYEITEKLLDDTQRVPIGKLIPNMNAVILSREGHLCPIGVAGEICVSGVGVGAGYLDLPERTAESFVANPFAELSGDVLYKTGDLGRWLSDGNMEFLGRADDQVKIRGHRVELEGIATVVRTSDYVEDSHVLVHTDDQGREYLLCFVTLSGMGLDVSQEVDISESLHVLCRGELPSYMHPSHYCVVDSFPVNLSDKVDGKALIRTFLSEHGELGALQSAKYVAPGNETEEKLAEIWQDLLGVERVGVHDNFFELGGHSLLITRLASGIVREVGIKIAISTLFQFSTISDIGKYIEIEKFNEEMEKNEENVDIISL